MLRLIHPRTVIPHLSFPIHDEGCGHFRVAGDTAGCDDGLAALSGLLDRVANRHGGALAVSGDAGIGKSSLVAAATVEVSRRAMCVLTTTGFQAETHDP